MVQFTREVRQQLWAAVRSGMWVWEAADSLGESRGAAERAFIKVGGVMEPCTQPSGRYLYPAEREKIAILHAQGHGDREIGRRIGRPHTTVGRELARNGNRDGTYRAATTAQVRAEDRGRRPKPGQLTLNPRLRTYVISKLSTEQWSPEQISHALRMEFPDEETMRCCPETIYRSLFVQGRGELRRELTRHLRTQRTVRKPQHRPERRKGRLVETVSIS